MRRALLRARPAGSRPVPAGRGGGWPARTAALLLAAGLLASAGCTFEQRGNGDDAPPEAEPGAGVGQPSEGIDDPTALVLDVLRTFREATAVGDISLALALMDREARLADDLVGIPDEDRTRGELLLALRSRLSGGLRLREESIEVSFPGEVAVVFSRLLLAEGAEASAGESKPPGPGAQGVHETAVLVPTPEGWRILHVHRSIPPSG